MSAKARARCCVAILLLVFVVGRVDFTWLAGDMNGRMLAVYSPYFPGLSEMHKHEIFDPKYSADKKIVFLGPSYVDSSGCDRSWSRADAARPLRNTHFSCRIDYQLGQILKSRGLGAWRPFNLGRNSASPIHMLYAYLAISDIRPELVVFGVDAERIAPPKPALALGGLRGFHITAIEKALGDDPELRGLWDDLRVSLSSWTWPDPSAVAQRFQFPIPVRIPPPQPLYAATLIAVPLLRLSGLKAYEGPPLPVKIYEFDRDASKREEAPNGRVDLRMVNVLEIIHRMQQRSGHRLLVYQSPRWEQRGVASWDRYFSEPFADEMARRHIPELDLTDLPLIEAVETYDGSHQTLEGNRRIAEALMHEFDNRRLLEEI